MIGVNVFDGAPRYSINEIREALGVADDTPIVDCDARNKDSVKISYEHGTLSDLVWAEDGKSATFDSPEGLKAANWMLALDDAADHLHSVRLPGLVAHQEIIFGGPGQILTLRHDSISRESFMPGVVFAVKEVTKRSGLVYGLDRLMGLA